MDNLGQRLKVARQGARMTLRELARQAEVSPSLISQIENGKSQPSVATLYSFSKLLNVSVDELFEDREGPARPTPATDSSTPGSRATAAADGSDPRVAALGVLQPGVGGAPHPPSASHHGRGSRLGAPGGHSGARGELHEDQLRAGCHVYCGGGDR